MYIYAHRLALAPSLALKGHITLLLGGFRGTPPMKESFHQGVLIRAAMQ